MSTLLYGNNCDVDASSHSCDQCAGFEAGRVGYLAAVHKSYFATLSADPVTIGTWTTGISTGKIIMMSEFRGTISGTHKYKAGFGRRKEKYTGTDFKISGVDPVWLGNHAFYNDMLESPSYYVVWATETKAQISKYPATWKPDEPTDDQVDSDREWKLDIEFTQRGFSTPFTFPVGLFDCVTVGP